MKIPGRWAVIVPLAYMAGLLLLSSIPGTTSGGQRSAQVLQLITPQWQNLLHIPLYGGLTLAWTWALAAYPLTLNMRLALSFILALAWAIVDETYQLSVPGRYGSLTDFALNGVGALCAALLLRRISRTSKSADIP